VAAPSHGLPFWVEKDSHAVNGLVIGARTFHEPA
jgi:hypothetical protein